MSNIYKNWKHQPLKDGFFFNFTKILYDRHFVVYGAKRINLLQDISFDSGLTICAKLYSNNAGLVCACQLLMKG